MLTHWIRASWLANPGVAAAPGLPGWVGHSRLARGSTSSPYTLTHRISPCRVGPTRAASVCAPSAVDSRWCALALHCTGCGLVVNMAVLSCLALPAELSGEIR